ncbi:MAG: CBS domain-containing protein [Chloroflexota bacterium]|nr:CBS domain-containing protein [Chloroflexota bacterium]
MKRLSLADALARLPAENLEAIPTEEGHEAAALNVRGGEVIAVVPKGTPDERVESDAVVIRGGLRLEDERLLTFQVRPGRDNVTFEDYSARLHPAPRRPAPPAVARQTAADIMTREVVAVSADMLVEDAAKLLAYHNISGMPVEGFDGSIVGVVSEADVIGHIGTTVSDVMTEDVISVGPGASVEEIAALMAERRIKRVPVMEDGRVVGIVSRADIVRALAART